MQCTWLVGVLPDVYQTHRGVIPIKHDQWSEQMAEYCPYNITVEEVPFIRGSN